MWPLSASEIYQAILKNQKCEKEFNAIMIKGVCIDSRKVNSDLLFVAIKGSQHDGHAYLKDCFQKGVQLALVDENSNYLNELTIEQKKKCICVSDVLASFRQFAKFMRSQFSFPVLGIGGSNGKTTTKEMIASILSGGNYKVTKTEKSENGFLGMAITLCQEDHNKNKSPDCLVLEIGIDDIGAMTQHVDLGQPNISILTALGPEHLEHLINWETAANEELILFKNPKTKRIWQLSDEKILKFFLEHVKLNDQNSESVISLKNDFIVVEKKYFAKIGIDKSTILKNISTLILWDIFEITPTGSEVSIEINSNISTIKNEKDIHFKVPLPGIHNASNFALAFASAIMLNRSLNEIALGWSKFVSPPMRSRISYLKDQNILFDDCYNSSPMSLEAALHAVQNEEWKEKNKLLILGDMLDLGNESKYWHENVFHALKNIKNAYLCLYGLAMYDCYKLLKETEDLLLSENKTRIFWRAAQDDPSQFLTDIHVNLSGFVILVKGSRGMKLDRVIKSIESVYC
nr:hypothetical protein GTC16762_11440 [Pigmentibacter ruber]